MFNFGTFIVKSLQLALVADQEYELTQTPGAAASTLLQPGNFQNLLLELASVVTPAAPATPIPATQTQAAPGATGNIAAPGQTV